MRLAPAGTPQPVTARLHRELDRIIGLPDMRERFAAEGYDAVTCTPEEFTRLIRSDLAKWQKVVKASGARVD